jgi:hypothetical protein
VWIQVQSLPLDQIAGSTPDASTWPLAIRLSALGAWVGRDPANGTEIPSLRAGFDWALIERSVATDRASTDDASVVVSAEDGVEYGAVIRAIDLARAHGYTAPELASP